MSKLVVWEGALTWDLQLSNRSFWYFGMWMWWMTQPVESRRERRQHSSRQHTHTRRMSTPQSDFASFGDFHPTVNVSLCATLATKLHHSPSLSSLWMNDQCCANRHWVQLIAEVQHLRRDIKQIVPSVTDYRHPANSAFPQYACNVRTQVYNFRLYFWFVVPFFACRFFHFIFISPQMSTSRMWYNVA